MCRQHARRELDVGEDPELAGFSAPVPGVGNENHVWTEICDPVREVLRGLFCRDRWPRSQLSQPFGQVQPYTIITAQGVPHAHHDDATLQVMRESAELFGSRLCGCTQSLIPT